MPNATFGSGKSKFASAKYLANAFFGLLFHYYVFFLYFAYNIKITLISPKTALAKYFWNVLKNRNNEICSSEICIRQGSPVIEYFLPDCFTLPQLIVKPSDIDLLIVVF